MNETPITRKERIKFKRQQYRIVKKLECFDINKILKCTYDSGELPKLFVKFDNYLCENALLDSGCNINLLSKNMFLMLQRRKLAKRVVNQEISCRAANSSEIRVTETCVVKVKVNRFAWNVKFHVSPNIHFKMILGSGFIRETQLIMNLSQNQCYFAFLPNIKISLNKVNANLVYSCDVNNSLNIGVDEVRPQILNIMQRYSDVFTDKIGRALDFEYKINLKDSEIVNQKPYPLSPPRCAEMKEIIDDLLKQNIIRPSISSYSSPSFLVSKPGSIKKRLVINYSKLNNKIERVNFPLGEMQDCHHFLKGAGYFSVIDLANSFMQIPLHEDSKHLTSFSTPFALYEFNRIPYGLHVGSGLLSSYLDKVFRDIKFDYVINFVDDILIYSKTKEDHLRHLEEVVKRLNSHGLTVNPSKVKLCHTEISFLGNIISRDKVTIDPSRTEAIRKFNVPKNVKELSSFIGMVSYFSKYIKNYAELAAPLNELRKKRCKFEWTDECNSNFYKLKDSIINPPVLAIADFKKPFILMTDASEVALGSTLLQKNEFGDNLPVAYYSKKFTDSERCLGIYEKEALSVVASIKKFYSYLEVQPFYLITDNHALSWVLTHFRKLGKIARWVECILSLPFYVMHVKSKENPVADCLSRMFPNEDKPIQVVDVLEEEFNVTPVKWKSCKKFKSVSSKVSPEANAITEFPLAYVGISSQQKSDPECLEIINSVKNKTCKENFFIKKDVLMYKKNDKSKPKIYVPKSLIDMLYNYYHVSNFGGHLGQSKTVAKVMEYFYREKLPEEIRSRVKNCEICKLSKAPQRRYEGELISGISSAPMDKLYVDLVGPLTRSKLGNNHILVVVDDMTKYVWLLPLKDAKTKGIVTNLEEVVFKNFGSCKQLVTDNAKYFVSVEFKNFMFKHCIEHYTIIPYRPSANKCERYIRNVKSQIRAFYHNCQNIWDRDLYFMQQSLNTARNDSTKFSAFELMFKRKSNHGLSNLWNVNELLNPKLTELEIKSMMNRAITNCKLSAKRNRKRLRYNADKSKHPFHLGDIVYLETHRLSKKAEKYQAKMDLKYSGPYKIIYFLSPVSVIIQSTKDSCEIKRAHIVNLKKQ